MDASPTMEQIVKTKGDITELDHHVKQLEKYRNEMVLKSIPNEEQSVKSAFESLLELTTNGLIQSEKCVHQSSMDHIYVPCSSHIKTTDCINCIGCGQTFNRLKDINEPAYYIHCINECDEYKDLNLIRKCDVCQKQFTDYRSKKEHLCRRPPKPDWMVPSMYSRGFSPGKNIKKCLGCGGKFLSSGDDWYSFDHLVHIVEKCSEYRGLDLIAECNECHFKFPNDRMCNDHFTRTHLMKKPKWMSHRIFVHGISASRSTKTNPVPCRGCGKELRKLQAPSIRGSYRLQDYIHMIKECPQYKEQNLIKSCDECGCKFINSKAFGKHKC